MTERMCSIDGCARPRRSLGFCAPHYKRTLSGRPLDIPIRKSRRLGLVLIRDNLGRKQCTNSAQWKPESDFNTRRASLDGLVPRCRKCERIHKMMNLYRLTLERLSEMLDSQDGRCAGCGMSDPRGHGEWHIDHDHSCCPGRSSCGECVRGLLCSRCNMALGSADDDPAILRALADYLERSRP